MAVTKVFAIKVRMDDRVKYVINQEKTALDAKIVYATNPEKTEQVFFTDTLNCNSVETAYQEMQATKRRFQKNDGVLGYHFIQSFAPGEVTPEQAHEIGMEFARRMFGDKYEAVIGTHLDKAHLHNHIVINSVSFINGEKYHSSPGSYYGNVRGTSDELCWENDLSVITPHGKGKHYGEWKADQEGKPTVRSTIREDIDRIIGQAYTYQSFLMLLQRSGYEIKSGQSRKYTAIRPPGGKRFIRLDSLGDDYTEAAIKRHLASQRSGAADCKMHRQYYVRHYRVKGGQKKCPKRRITGFQALYFRYLYLLRGTRRKKPSYRAAFSVREDVIRLERYEKQFRYLMMQNITTAEELESQIRRLEWDIDLMEQQRKPLYAERRNAENAETKEECRAKIDRQTAALRLKRQELALCRRIRADVPLVQARVSEAQKEAEKESGKEETQHEYQRRNR